MSEAKPTPGPWYAAEWSCHAATTVLVDDATAGIVGKRIVAECGTEADARLIAASKDLLAALRIAEQFMSIASDWNIDEAEINGEMRSSYHWRELVQAAIAKATGSHS